MYFLFLDSGKRWNKVIQRAFEEDDKSFILDIVVCFWYCNYHAIVVIYNCTYDLLL